MKPVVTQEFKRLTVNATGKAFDFHGSGIMEFLIKGIFKRFIYSFR